MRKWRNNRPACWGFGALWALAMSLWVCPSKAVAGCGDYVQRGQKSTALAISMPEHKPHSPARSGNHKFPCSGPNCSRGSRAPLDPVGTASTTIDHWANTQATISTKEQEPKEAVPSIFFERLHHNVLAVYHPPRASF